MRPIAPAAATLADRLKKTQDTASAALLRSAVQVLQQQWALHPDKTAIVFLADGERETERVTFAQLAQRARAMAAALQARGAARQRVLIALPSGIGYAVAFIGALMAGAVPVPLHVPPSPAHAERLARIVADCDARCLVGEARQQSMLVERFTRCGWSGAAAAFIACDAHGGDASAWQAPDLALQDLAFLQYTSGSTGDPRGVMVSHCNLLHHARQMQAGLQQHADDVFVSWLPLFHDMGLVGQLLQSLLLGATLVLMPPSAFLRRPLCWLEALSRHSGTMSFAPNFGYSLCVVAAAGGRLPSLHLSHWRVAANAAEPVRKTTMDRFAQCFAGAGLRPEALVAGYGLAEATLHATLPRRVAGSLSCGAAEALGASAAASPKSAATPPARAATLRDRSSALCASATALQAGVLRPAEAPEREHWLVAVGTPVEGDELIVVDPVERQRCADGGVGEVWLRSAAVAGGYWQRPEDTARAFGAQLADGSGPWLRTGDLGAWHEGDLYIVGRLKDLIIVRGQNHHPADIEHSACRSHPAIHRAAAFGVDVAGQEQVVVMAELRRSDRHQAVGEAVLAALRAALADLHGLGPHALWLLRPAALPLTSSGKLRRAECRRLFEQRLLDPVLAWQQDAGPRPQADPAANALPNSPMTRLMDALATADADAATRELLPVLFDCTAQALNLDERRRAELRPVFAVQALNMIGLDSLAAVDLARRLKVLLGLEVPLDALLGGITGEQAAHALYLQLALQQVTAPVASQAPSPMKDMQTWQL
jgi:acyl-CoA synthetase (AMP-forming)/AMP-acid ligase II